MPLRKMKRNCRCFINAEVGYRLRSESKERGVAFKMNMDDKQGRISGRGNRDKDGGHLGNEGKGEMCGMRGHILQG